MARSEEADSRLLTAVVTEHVVLQSISGASISESGSRSVLYVSAVSGGLVALGFGSANHRLLIVLAATILPVLALLGVFTVVRLVDTAIDNIAALRQIDNIHAYYATLDPTAASLFGARATTPRNWDHKPSGLFFTAASAIIAVNTLITGAATSVLVSEFTNASLPTRDAATAVACLAWVFVASRMQNQRIRRALEAE